MHHIISLNQDIIQRQTLSDHCCRNCGFSKVPSESMSNKRTKEGDKLHSDLSNKSSNSNDNTVNVSNTNHKPSRVRTIFPSNDEIVVWFFGVSQKGFAGNMLQVLIIIHN